ncbi:MAG: hypothetical protein ACTSPW_08960, partial [Promethearchaeota archaeon]
MELDWMFKVLGEVRQLCAEKGLTESTVKKKICYLEKILKGIRAISAAEINGWIDSYVSEKSGKLLGPHGKNNYAVQMKWLLRRSKLIGLPGKEIAKIRRYKAKDSGRYIEQGEFYRILSYAPDMRYELAFLLIYETGIRPHELLSVRLKDVEVRSDGRL